MGVIPEEQPMPCDEVESHLESTAVAVSEVLRRAIVAAVVTAGVKPSMPEAPSERTAVESSDIVE
jgi:hypothetical protein